MKKINIKEFSAYHFEAGRHKMANDILKFIEDNDLNAEIIIHFIEFLKEDVEREISKIWSGKK